MLLFNLETAALNESLNAAQEDWVALSILTLRRHDRNVAVGAIAEEIQRYVGAQGLPADALCAALYGAALRRIDFYSLALQMVQMVESADSSLVKMSEAQAYEEELDEPIAA